MSKNHLFNGTALVMVVFVIIQCLKKPGDASPLSYYLPKSGELEDWESVDASQAFEGEDLYLYINGGAEIYHEYGFKRVITQEYRNKNDRAINLEIFEMKNAQAAYGIYTFKIGDSGREISVGQDALLEEYYLNFWKGNFLITLTGFDSAQETVEGLLALARAVDAKIEIKGKKPILVSLLPKDPPQIVPAKYTRGSLGLSNHYALGPGNIFGLKEGIIGDYGNFRVFIFRYDDEVESLNWLQNAKNHLKESDGFSQFIDREYLFSTKDSQEKLLTAEQCREYILIVSGEKNAATEDLLEKIRDRIQHNQTP